MSNNGLLSQFSWTLAGRVASSLLQAATLAVVARVAGPAEFGIFAAALGIGLFLQTVFDLGITTYALKLRARSPNSGLITTTLLVGDRMALACAVTTGIAIAIAAFFEASLWTLAPLAVWVAAERNTYAWLRITIADAKARTAAAITLTARVIAFITTLALISTSTPATLAAGIGLAIGSCASMILAHRTVRPRLPERTSMSVLQLLQTTWPYWLHSLTSQIKSLDATIVALVSTPIASGLYAVASRLTNPLRIVPTAASTVIVPRIARERGTISRNNRLAAGGMLIAVSIIYVLIALLAPVGIPIVLGSSYTGAVPAVQVVCIGLIFSAASIILAGILQAIDRERWVSTASLVTSVVCVPLVALGADKGGPAGAALALSSVFALQSAWLTASLYVATRTPPETGV